jgi:hypothetical protein
MNAPNETSAPQVGVIHYQLLCAFCLAVVLLIQLQAGLVLTNLFGILIGAAGLVFRLRLAPILFVALVAIAQLTLAHGAHFDYVNRTMTPNDVFLCAAVLGYVSCHFRLQSIWYGVLPSDPRLRAGPPRRAFPWIRRREPLVHEKRGAQQITPRELAWLVATLPLWAVAAQLANKLIPRQWYLLGFPATFIQILVVLWLLAVGFAVVRAFLNYWTHRDHDAATAQLYLQDILWRDTRGEQRRVNRWLAWWKLKHPRDD